jgi:hypothetical protein
MLKLLKRWLGWDSDSSPFDFSGLQPGTRQRSAPPNVVPPKVAPKSAAPSPQGQTSPKPNGEPKAPKKPRKDRAPMDVLDNPRLTLDRPNDDGFDPYNTGAFNRSQSWEKIGRNKKR